MAESTAALHFLIAVDGSEHSLAALRWIAQIAAAGARLRCTLLNVQKPIMSGEVGVIAPAGIAMAKRDRSAADILEHAAAILRPAGLRIAIEEQLDDAAAAVVARAEALGCDAIVIGRRGLGVLRAALLGSVSSEVVRRSSVPVIVIGPVAADPPAAPLRLLVATDGSKSAIGAAAFASRLAALADSEVHLLHVAPVLTVAGALFGPRESVLDHWSGKLVQEALDGARDLLVGSGVKYMEHVVASDDPRTAILDAAREHRCGIIAMGTRGLGPVTGLLLGSVAQGVLEGAPRAVPAVALVR